MKDELVKIIENSSFEVNDGVYIYTKVKSFPEGDHFMVTKDRDEITVVTLEDKVAELDLIERNKESYKLISLNVSVPFYSVGFLAAVSNAVAKEGINILIISTY